MFKHRSVFQLKRHFSLDGRNKLSNKFIPVTKDKNAELSSHSTLLKAGFVRQSGPGIFSLLPLGLRTIEKIEKLIDEEMKSVGGEKLSLPLMLNPESWKKTGRWSGSKGEFFRLKDRKENDLLLAPTHEEEITQLVANELRAAKQLPIRLYQIGRKYRDELRPRAGLLRGREFIMKDLYSFDATQADAYKTYEEVGEAYRRIFRRLGVPFVVAEADSGNIGGSKSHEYHLISSVGEDTLLTCDGCGYTANEELAVGRIPLTTDHNTTPFTFQTPDGPTHATVLTPPGRHPNLLRVQKTLSDGAGQVTTLIDQALTIEIPGAVKDHFRLTESGDGCVHCESQLGSVKAIECGHTFYLGTKYSKVLGCEFKDLDGQKKPAEMGCYGIGISRLLAAIAEARLDEAGVCWPRSVAPYQVCIVPTDDRKESFRQVAHQVYDALESRLKDDVVIDDRRSGFGAKMKDAELVGYPYTVVVGPKTIEEGQIEIHERIQGQQSKKTIVSLDELIQNKVALLQ